MISSVTTTTVSTVTSTGGFAASLGFIAVLTLISLLLAKELASVPGAPRLQRFSHGLNVAIIPLLMVLTAIVAAKVVQVL
jgi:chromate transport protein ChrA